MTFQIFRRYLKRNEALVVALLLATLLETLPGTVSAATVAKASVSKATKSEKTTNSTGTVTLEQVIQLAQKESEALRAAEKTIEAAQAEINSRDLELSPTLSGELSTLRDRTDNPGGEASKSSSLFLGVEYDQLFATGTKATVTAGNELADFSKTGQQNVGSWGVLLSQSLWQNAFGRATQLRRDSDQAELKARIVSAFLERQNFVVSLEQVYWDLSLALKEEQIRKANIEASRVVEGWTRDRVRRSAAEPADLLQAQALTSNRELQLIAARNKIEDLRRSLAQRLPDLSSLGGVSVLSTDVKALERERDINQLMVGASGSGDPVTLEALSAQYSARKEKIGVDQAVDQSRPKLDAFVSYGQNGINDSFGGSWERAVDPSRSATKVGVTLSMELDRGLVNERDQAARAKAEAQELRARAEQRESSVGWAELAEDIDNLELQVKEAARLSDLQARKVDAERNRFRLGRSTIFQLITFEVDAAEAELQHYRLLAELRKAESRARLYTRATPEGPESSAELLSQLSSALK